MIRFRQLLRIAYDHVPYYNHVFNKNKIDIDLVDDLEKLPITTKEDIREYGLLNFINNEYLDKDFHFMDDSKITITTSSGTTGVPMDVIWDKKTYLASTLPHWIYRRKNALIMPSDTYFTSQRFKGNNLNCVKKSEREYAINTNILTHEGLVKVFKILNDIQPDWLLIQPSMLYILVQFSLENNLTFPCSIKYVEYFSEYLLPFYRKKIENVLKCFSANMYACSETQGIAYECSQKNMHVLEGNVSVEILKKNKRIAHGKKGNVCVTNLHNYVMPIIRYKLNDKAYISDKPCPCGEKSHTIQLINTRIPEFVLFDDLDFCKLGRIYFPFDRIGFIKKEKEDILFNLRRKTVASYQIVFDNKSCGNWPKWKITNAFKQIMDKYGLGDCEFAFDFTENIDLKIPSGLLRM